MFPSLLSFLLKSCLSWWTFFAFLRKCKLYIDRQRKLLINFDFRRLLFGHLEFLYDNVFWLDFFLVVKKNFVILFQRASLNYTCCNVGKRWGSYKIRVYKSLSQTQWLYPWYLSFRKMTDYARVSYFLFWF